jgi:hypothetical protein
MRRLVLSAVFAAVFAPALSAATVVLFDPAAPGTGPFPTDFLTVPDPAQKTGLRMNLPLPDCAAQYTSCQEIGLLEQADGFNLRARANVRFSGPVDTSTLRAGIFFVALDERVPGEPGVQQRGDRIGVNQVVWDPATNTAYAKPDAVLDQHRRYALVVTDAVRDAAGTPVGSDNAWTLCGLRLTPYCDSLAQSLAGIDTGGSRIVAASVFTTTSATAWLEHARMILDYVPPVVLPVYPRSTFRVPDVASITLHEQVGTNPSRFADLTLPIDPTLLAGLDRLVMGTYFSPNFLEGDQAIRPVPTLPELEIPAARNQVYFNALLPSTPQPAAGYPVVIFGHGFGDSRFGGPTAVAPTLARAGLATIAINAVGHGFGPESSVTITGRDGRATTLFTGGRSIDVNGDGVIQANEGCALVTPVAYATRDCFRQTVVDLMQLVRAIRLGLDLDGDGRPDLDPARIYYAGQSLGAIYGTILTAVEPNIRAAALNVGGGSMVDIARWSPSYLDLTTEMLALRVPPLLNKGNSYNEDYVLPDQPVKTVTVPGALAIQDVLERLEWLGMQGDPLAFAPHLKPSGRPVLMQFARGDQTVPNPANSNLVRAAGLEANTWMYRHDLARAKAPDLPANPHAYLVLFVSLDGSTIKLPGIAGISITLDAQQQIAGFLAADGAAIPDPNVLSRLLLGISVFQVPAALPMDLGF